jgi:uncharacterized protein
MAEEKTPAAERTLKGILQIEIDEQALKVNLTFESTSDGDSWSEERIVSALWERGIQESIPEDKLRAFLKKASTTGPVSEVILKGIPPVEPAPDTPVWEDLPIPDELQELSRLVLADAEKPLIKRTVKETVEREREISRKAGFPFMKEKVEKKTVREQVTREEKVYIDPTVHSVLYLPEEGLAGRITPGSAGMPGRNVFGAVIQIRTLADPEFHLGQGLRRERDEIRSGEAGFVRIGKNWADLVPFSRHSWSVELSTDRATCYLLFEPGHPRDELPAAEAILDKAAELDYPMDSLAGAEEIEKVLREHGELRKPDRINISNSRDAAFDIFVPEDRLSAFLNIHKGKGRGKPLSLREVGGAIKQSGLKGLDFDRIKTDITAFYESGDMDLTSYLLCEGRAPLPGPPRNAEYSIVFDHDAKTDRIKTNLLELLKTTTPAELEDVHLESFQEFPPHEIQKTAEVQPEQLLCTIDPPTPGEPGMDVYGVIIPAEPGPAPDIRLFENVELKNSLIVTTTAGVLDYTERRGGGSDASNVDDENIASDVEASADSSVTGATEESVEAEPAVLLRVRPHKDARVEVNLSDDRMEARLTLEEGYGSGSRLSRQAIDAVIEGKQIVHGILEDTIARGLEAARAGTAVTNLVIARGTDPVDQSENRIEFLVDVKTGAPVRIRKDGTADFRSRGEIVTIEEGQEICRVLPPRQEAEDGTDVLGKTVPAGKHTGTALEYGEGVKVDQEEDGTVVVRAGIVGKIRYANNRLDVAAVHSIKGDIDMSVGNIRFPGTVIIGGTVRSGFYVISSGDVNIAGAVEGALISSDGNIVIKEGVKGAGKAVLRSKQNISSPFVELATILAVGDLVLKSALVRSRIKCNGKILFKGDKGRIVGGTIRARNGFEVTSVGSPRGIKTQLSFGQDYLVADLIEKEEGEIEKVKRRITQVDLEMRKQEKAGATTPLEALRREKVKLLKLMEKRGLRLFTLRERFEQHFPSRIVVSGEAHSGTVFESHGRTYEITNPRKAFTVEFNPHTGNIDVNELKEG